MKTKTICGVTFYSKGKNEEVSPQQYVLDLMSENGHKVMVKYDKYAFGSVANHLEFAELIRKSSEKNRMFNEVLLDNTPQYLFCDIDGEFKDLQSTNVCDYLDAIIEKLGDEIGDDFKPNDLRILSSSNDDKLSLHITYPHIIFKNYEHQKRFWQEIVSQHDDRLVTIFKRKDNVYERRNVIDLAVYSKNRPMRTIYSHKEGSNRILKPYIYRDKQLIAITDVKISDYFISQPDLDPDIQVFEYGTDEDMPRAEQQLLKQEDIERIIQELVPDTKISGVKGSLFALTNTGPRTCLLSGTVHDSNGCYVVWKRDGLYFGCHAAGCKNKSVMIHRIEHRTKSAEPIIPDDTHFKAESFMNIVYYYLDEDGNTHRDIAKESKVKQQYFEKYVAYISSLSVTAVKVSPKTWTLYSGNNAATYFSNCTFLCNVDFGIKLIPFFKHWLSLVDRKQYTNIAWCPFTINKPDITEDTLNIFTQFKHEYLPNFKVDMSLIQPWLHHLEYVWADRDQKIYDYLIKWFAFIMQKCTKTGVNIVIKSIREGAGKNILTDFICKHVLGVEYTRQFSDIDSLLGKFNASAEKSLLTILDELGAKGGAFKNHNRLKDITTRVLMPVERKNVDAYMAVDRNSNIFSSNDDWIMKMSMSDRRNLCIEASSIYIDNQNYWDNLISYSTDEVGLHFFQFLLQVDLSRFRPKNIPVTEWKRALLDKCKDPYFKTLLSVHQKQCDKVFSSELMSIYNTFAATKYDPGFTNIKSFNCAWKKYTGWISKPIRIDQQKKIGYAVTPELLIDTARKIRKDPDYEFEPEEDAEDMDMDMDLDTDLDSDTAVDREPNTGTLLIPG